jgi:hypothetical protein
MILTKDDWVKEPDQVQLFTLYTLFGGNVDRVSVVTRVPKEQIEGLAHDYNWKAKACGRGRLDTEEGAEAEKVMNRVSSYSTALRMDRVMNNLVAELDKDPAFARAFCTKITDEGGTEFSVKNLVDLAKGIEIVNNIKYRALGDKQAQDADTTQPGAKNVAEISLTVYKGLASRFDRNDIVDTTKQIIKAAVDAVKQDPEKD